MPEQLAFQQRVGHGRAVERNEWTLAARATLMKCAGHQFLPSSALTRDEHRRLALATPSTRPAHAAKRRALPQDVLERLRVRDRLPQAFDLVP